MKIDGLFSSLHWGNSFFWGKCIFGGFFWEGKTPTIGVTFLVKKNPVWSESENNALGHILHLRAITFIRQISGTYGDNTTFSNCMFGGLMFTNIKLKIIRGFFLLVDAEAIIVNNCGGHLEPFHWPTESAAIKKTNRRSTLVRPAHLLNVKNTYPWESRLFCRFVPSQIGRDTNRTQAYFHATFWIFTR